MTKDAFRLIGTDGTETELPVRKGAVGPDVIDIGKLYKEQGVFTYDQASSLPEVANPISRISMASRAS